ncbi:MAG: hypothetical protein R2715_10785 [Ilumatobacteraceae bacterium]
MVEEVAPPSTLPENLEPKGSPANFVVVVGNYGLPARIDSLDPLVLDTLNQNSPTDVVIASNGAGDPTKRRPVPLDREAARR